VSFAQRNSIQGIGLEESETILLPGFEKVSPIDSGREIGNLEARRECAIAEINSAMHSPAPEYLLEPWIIALDAFRPYPGIEADINLYFIDVLVDG